MPNNDDVRLRHMLEATSQAIEAVSGRTRKDLERDRVWMLGLVKCVEIVGEAAARTSQETRDKHPQIPWPQIVGMRNRLVHMYFDIDLEQVWKTVTEDLPTLAKQLQPIIDRLDG